MKIKLIGAVLIFFTLSILMGFLNGFMNPKSLYAGFYPEKYFVKDSLIYIPFETAFIDAGDYYLYSGNLKNNKIKIEGLLAHRRVEAFDKIPVWYCKLSKHAFWRKTENDSLIFVNDILNTLMMILWLPTLIYYLYLKYIK